MNDLVVVADCTEDIDVDVCRESDTNIKRGQLMAVFKSAEVHLIKALLQDVRFVQRILSTTKYLDAVAYPP
jgi:hypothetical protein